MPARSPLPAHLKPFRHKALAALKEGVVRDIDFSGGTYQVLVDDQRHERQWWCFLQVDDEGALGDSFCSCEEEADEESKEPGCEHLATAYLALFGSHRRPLHVRFRLSLWNSLCRLFCERLGGEADIFKPCTAGWHHLSPGGKEIVFCGAADAVALDYWRALLWEREPVSEETSIKFSSLTQEELTQWREGEPSPELVYELSFWSDLAKTLMLRQERGRCPLVELWPVDQASPPHYIKVDSEGLMLRFYLSEANWPLVIPALDYVKSNIKVFDTSFHDVEAMEFDEKSGVLRLSRERQAKGRKKSDAADASSQEGYRLGRWLWVPKAGFIAKDPHHLLQHDDLRGEQVTNLLEEMPDLVKEALQGAELHDEPLTLSYHLSFDDDWNLHIEAYAFHPGDLSGPHSHLFNPWVYVAGDGFWRVDGSMPSTAHRQIDEGSVGDFISKERLWLNAFEGFATHLSSVEEQLTYSVDKTGRLTFALKEHPLGQGRRSHDFGVWLYVEGEGFYAKSAVVRATTLYAGLEISPPQVPLFIRMHQEELLLVPGFFSEGCPIDKSGLRLTVRQPEDKPRLLVQPYYEVRPDATQGGIIFFDDVVYWAGQGFSLLPGSLRLPDAYRQPKEIGGDELVEFVAYEMVQLQGYFHDLDGRLRRPLFMKLVVESTTELSDEKGWYSVKLWYESDIGRVDAFTVWKAISRGLRFIFSAAGLIDLSEAHYRWLAAYKKNRFDGAGRLSLSTIELIRLNAVEGILESTTETAPTAEGQQACQLLQALTDFKATAPPATPTLKSQLRPYQQLGLQWLWFLFEHRLSGLLCDDMGLGKTHQAMALLDAACHRHGLAGQGSLPFHSLIVCPTSVLFHWQEKLAAYLPQMGVLTFYGQKRSLDSLGADYPIVLTTYGILRREIDKLAKIPFSVAIFDEIQMAKNYQSRLFKAIKGLQAQIRLGMTGTPIENYLRELKSLFDLMLPGYLPPDKAFRTLFIKPIEKEGDRERKELLSRLVRPFIMRRKKEEVLAELPPKDTEVLHCALHEGQRHLYNEVLTQSRRQLLEQLSHDSTPMPYMHIFSVLTALKQICDHPAVFMKNPAGWRDHQSGKWDLFCELLDEARQSGHKVVVFTQYLHMLDIMADYLTEKKIGYTGIRGSTKRRDIAVSRFQQDPSCEVFLASLHAAGTGIDLTAGSVVIHYDRWWNAAREEQATDRVHRIGQNRGVLVLKLVTLDTLEERIDKIIERKRNLLEDVVVSDDHNVLKSFDRQEIISLLRLVEASQGADIPSDN